jgi:hypothetical protein
MSPTNSDDIDTTYSLRNDTSSKVKLVIHHQFSGIELISPVYAGKGITCHLSPDQIVDVGSTTQAGFNIDPGLWWWPSGVLMYKLQKNNIDQSNDEATYIQLIMIWNVNRSKNFFVNSFIAEYDQGCVWDEDRLMKLAKNCRPFNIQHGSIEDTWLMHDHTVLMTRMDITREEKCYKIEMTISETSIKDDTQRIQYIDMER